MEYAETAGLSERLEATPGLEPARRRVRKCPGWMEGLAGRLRAVLGWNALRARVRRYLTWPLYLARYALAVRHWDQVRSVREAIRRQFSHKWVTGVIVAAKPLRGESRGVRPFWPRCDIHSDAPVTWIVCHEDQQMLMMSGWIEDGCLFIRQLQGAKKVRLHRSLYMKWPRMLVAASQEAARASNLREVRLMTSARCRVTLPPSSAQVKEVIEERILETYDRTAERLGFAEEGRWHVWRNPEYRAAE